MRPGALAAAWLSLVAGCWSGAPAAPAESRPVHAIHTCAVDPPTRMPQPLQLVHWLGRIGDRSWLIAKRRAQLQLVGLDDSIDLAIDVLRADYVAGTHLWLAGTRDQHHVLVDVELDSPTPRPSPPIDLGDIAPLSTIDAVALGTDRILLAEQGPKVSFQLFDRAHRKLGVQTQITTTDPAAPELRCNGDRCFAIGIEGEGPMRRLYVERFAADGQPEHEPLTSDRVWRYHVAASGERTVVVWTSLDVPGLFMRLLDGTGRPLTRRAAISGLGNDTHRVVMKFELLPATPPRIAVNDGSGGWIVGALDVGANRLDEVRPLPITTDSFAGVVMPDGILGVGYTGSVEFTAGTHRWTSHATEVFVPSTRDTEVPVDVLDASGIGRGGRAAFPLVAPGHAGVLVTQGYEEVEGGELVRLRRPCR